MYDLRINSPPRWNIEYNDIIWLSRIIVKTRAFEAGTLGIYFYGQSPVDKSFLEAIGITYTNFYAIVQNSKVDSEVLTQLEKYSPGATKRLQEWTKIAKIKYKKIFYLIDADEGYIFGILPTILRFSSRILYPAITFSARKILPFSKS